MGVGRAPGPYRVTTLRMRQPELKDVSVSSVQVSDDPILIRLDSKKLVVGVASDVDVDTETTDLDNTAPMSVRLTRDMVGRQIKFKLEKPVVSVDFDTGIITGTSTLSVPDAAYPERLKEPTTIPVRIVIKIPQSVGDLEKLHASVEACSPLSDQPGKAPCIEAKIEIEYDHKLLAKLVSEIRKTANDVSQTGTNRAEIAQVALDVQDLLLHVLPDLAKSVLLKAKGTAPATWFESTYNPVLKTSDTRIVGFNAIPKGAIFDFTLPAWGYSSSHVRRQDSLRWTAGLLAYPSLPSIFAGGDLASMFPSYLYGEVAYTRKVSKGLDLGVKLTVAADIWKLAGQEAPEPPKSLSQQFQDLKDNKSPTDTKPFIMFQVEGHFDWFGSK